nr:hypothetical protein [Mesorhizobium sp.]
MEFLIGDCPWLPSATNAGGRKRRLKEVTWLDQPMIDCGNGLNRRVDGSKRSVPLIVDSEDCHQPVADEIVDEPAIPLYDVANLGEVAIEQIHHIIGRKLLGQFREIGDIAEENRNLFRLAGTRLGRTEKLAWLVITKSVSSSTRRRTRSSPSGLS